MRRLSTLNPAPPDHGLVPELDGLPEIGERIEVVDDRPALAARRPDLGVHLGRRLAVARALADPDEASGDLTYCELEGAPSPRASGAPNLEVHWSPRASPMGADQDRSIGK